MELTPEQREQILKDGTLKITVTTTTGALLPPKSIARILSGFETAVRSVYRSKYGPKISRVLTIGIREWEIFPAIDGGLSYEITLIVLAVKGTFRFNWQTDEEMQSQIDGWKSRRDAMLNSDTAAPTIAAEGITVQ